MKTRVLRAGILALVLALLAIALVACAHEHIYGEWSVETEPTCVEDGLKVRVCECEERETEVIPAKGHNFCEWTQTKAPTCTEEGVLTRTCACGEIETTPIEPTGHTFGAWSVTKKPTCVKSGEESRTCICGEKEKRDVAQTGVHNYTSVISVKPTCRKQGVETFTCSMCKDVYNKTINHETYNATDIYELYKNSVGEVIAYDKNGNEISLGSCFVYMSNGGIVTNYHVIENAYFAEVKLNGKSYTVSYVLAYDKDIDLAVLQIPVSNIKIADVCNLPHDVGNVVYTIGSSQGLESTFSDGMITYSNRKIDNVSYIQHDAPISSGNSGGPLINEYGEVIGINTWTVRDSQNLNFAIATTELSNLKYNERLTMQQLYDKESNAYIKLKNYAIQNGTKNSDSYDVILGVQYGSGLTLTYKICYYIDQYIMISVNLNDQYYVAFAVEESLDGKYKWVYLDEKNYAMLGYIYADTFTDDTLLGYIENNLPTAALRSSTRELASTLVAMICDMINSKSSVTGVTTKDLGFKVF